MLDSTDSEYMKNFIDILKIVIVIVFLIWGLYIGLSTYAPDFLKAGYGIAVVISAIFVGIQIKLASNQSARQNKKDAFNKSFQLVNFYINDIIPRLSVIDAVFQTIGIKKTIIDKLKDQPLKSFNREELEQYFSKQEIRDILTKTLHPDLVSLLNCFDCFDNGQSTFAYCRYIDLLNAHPQPNNDANKLYKRHMALRVDTLITQAKNDLEYFSMYFNSDLAESAPVYDSLHQTFVRYVQLLYPFIAINNTKRNCTQRYFTNIQQLYCKWDSQELQIAEKVSKNVSKIINHANDSVSKMEEQINHANDSNKRIH